MVTLPVGPLPHKEVLGLYIRAWLSKITAVLLPWLSGAMTFQRIWNRLQLVRFKVETFTTAVVIEPVIVCNSGRSSFQHVPTCSNMFQQSGLLMTFDDLFFCWSQLMTFPLPTVSYCELWWIQERLLKYQPESSVMLDAPWVCPAKVAEGGTVTVWISQLLTSDPRLLTYGKWMALSNMFLIFVPPRSCKLQQSCGQSLVQCVQKDIQIVSISSI